MTAARLGARVWISAHDGEKEVKGLANGLLKVRKRSREEVVAELGFEVGLEELDRRQEETARRGGGKDKMERKGESRVGDGRRTEVMVLGIGEEVVLDSEGVCDPRLQAGGVASNREKDATAIGPVPGRKPAFSDEDVAVVTEGSSVVTPLPA